MNALPPVLDAFLSASWRGAVLALVVLGLRLIFRRQVPAQVFAGAWVVVALVWLVPLSFPAAWSPFNWANKVAAVAPLEGVTWAEVREVEAPGAASAPVADGGLLPAAAARVNQPESTGPRVIVQRELIAWIWLGGAALLALAQAITSAWWARRLRRHRGPMDARLSAAFSDACREMRIKRGPELVVTSLVGSPALCGVGRARLIFPAGLATTLTDEELRWVLRHELGHHARRDLWTLALVRLAAVMHWFNPVAWFAARWARHDCELACDEFVLRRAAGERPEDYGRTLLKVLGAQRRVSGVPAAIGIVETKRQLLRRLTMIMHYRPVGFRRAVLGAALLGGLAIVGITQEKAPTAPTPRTPPTAEEMAKMRVEVAAKLRAWSDNVNLDLRAVGVVGGVPVALIDVDGEPTFVKPGMGLYSHTLLVEEIDVVMKQVTVHATLSKTRRVLPLTNPREVAFPVVDAKRLLALTRIADAGDYEWDRLPAAITARWRTFSRETKEEILLSYLASAKVLQVGGTNAVEGFSVATHDLLAEERQVLQKERREKFLASLTPEQREKFGQGVAPAIRLDAPKAEQEKAYAEAVKARAIRDEVLTNLTPEQTILYAQWMGKLPTGAQPLPSAPLAPQGASRPTGTR
jgi:beta-lactamase regulating signal transducer with metallopeptidase domain